MLASQWLLAKVEQLQGLPLHLLTQFIMQWSPEFLRPFLYLSVTGLKLTQAGRQSPGHYTIAKTS